jgi:hypothetical protein
VTIRTGCSLLGTQTFVTLNNLAAALNNEVVDQKLFLIIGYSDASEYLGFSIELSLLHAGSVLNYVAGRGVARNRLYSRGYACCIRKIRMIPTIPLTAASLLSTCPSDHPLHLEGRLVAIQIH